ncbi:sulfatase-like hydrolase/transferase [Lentisphaera profundi]|uniref:Sulfatase-like hydrolase/transferase n=1 Tax=Lentisphaera profundi TaxID=1658616 RepID=A0ABY7VS01_9BACT|nr:sulfatase-like hydrolase/transferase [Lentisphaera profundi]WDE96514.1 sulfatase-like hydrolase/transferase [Lentisphaera profundi]
MRFLSLLLLFSLCVTASEKPNIVIILADDVGFEEYGIYGVQKGASNTPNIDRLGLEGVTFQTCWAQSICGASRALLYSGNYAIHNGRYDNKLNYIPGDDLKENNLPQFTKILHDGGYSVGFAGKWHNTLAGKMGLENDKLGIDEYIHWGKAETLEEISGATLTPDENWEIAAISKDQITSRFWKPHLVENGKLLNTTMNDYGPDMFTDFICDFMEDKVKKEQTFLAIYAMVLAHSSHTVTPYEVAGGAKPSNFHYRKGTEQGTKMFKSQVRYMDKLTGKILKKIKDLGIDDNTIIICGSDNGTTSSSKSRGVEYGVHVPFIVAGAGIEKRGMVSQLTDFSDLLPTIVDFAGLAIPEDKSVDGISIKAFLTGASEKTKPVIYAFPGVATLVRTEEFMLEAVSPLYDHPLGRFYKTHGSFDGRAYENITHNPECLVQRKEFEGLLTAFPNPMPKSFDDPQWKSYKGLDKAYKHFNSKGQRKNHLALPQAYKFYDPSF